MLDAHDGGRLPPRRSVSERAAQRERMQRTGRNRYANLLHTLQAGQELAWQPRSGGHRLTWHPIAGKLIRAAAVVGLLYGSVTAALGIWRDGRVDTWSGPDGLVTSGQRLANCPQVGLVRDDLFPCWIRFDGAVYALTASNRPMGFKADPDFPWTGYRLDQMALYRTLNTPDGVAGRIVLVKLDPSPVGRVYRQAPDCT